MYFPMYVLSGKILVKEDFQSGSIFSSGCHKLCAYMHNIHNTQVNSKTLLTVEVLMLIETVYVKHLILSVGPEQRNGV